MKRTSTFYTHTLHILQSKNTLAQIPKDISLGLKKKAAYQTLANSVSLKYGQTCLKTDFLPVGNHSRQCPNLPVRQ